MKLVHRVRSIESRLKGSSVMNRAASAERRRDLAGGHPLAADPLEHLEAALAWLVRAQDATPDGGVARGYAVAWSEHFRRRGWQPSYPETTGYIIPTFFDAAAALDRPELAQRAVRMADWEIEVQLPSGAVQGGTIGEGPPSPAVFNTGQVIFGWLRAYRETGRDAYLEAARRAGDFLLGTQAPDGAFRKGASRFAREDCTTYNTRVAWALCQLGRDADEPRYTEAGARNVEFGISRQLENGWFRENCLSDPERPLLHTIAYATRGILEAGVLMGNESWVEAARRTARALAARQRPDGGLAGRFAHDWSERADWDCLTGDVQMAIVWAKLAAAVGDAELGERAREICRFVMRSQNRSARDPGLRGGIKGSFPIDGEYGRYEVLNWATKFFVDALLLTLPAERFRSAASVSG